MAAASNEPKSSWYDWSKAGQGAASTDPETAPGTPVAEPPPAPGGDAGETDEFGVQLRWPAGSAPQPGEGAARQLRPTRFTTVPASGADAPDPSAPPLVPLLAARFEMLEARLSMLILRSDAQAAAAEQAFDTITARLDSLAASIADLGGGAGGGDGGVTIEAVRVGLDDLIADVAGLRDDLTQVRRRLPVRARPDQGGGAAELEPLADLIVGRLMERFELADPVEAPEAPDPGAKRPRRDRRLRG
jgi:hypothetical protein